MIRFVFACIFTMLAIPFFFVAWYQRRKTSEMRKAYDAARARWDALSPDEKARRYSLEPDSRRMEEADAARLFSKIIAWSCLVLGALLGFLSTIRIVDANTVGIPVTVGHIGEPMQPGFQFTAPWTEVHQFSTRAQELSMLAAADEGDKSKDDSIEVRGSDGYKMNVDITIRYFIEPDAASRLFRLVGDENGVKQKLVRPDVRDRVRVAFAEFTSEEGYTSARDAIVAALLEDLTPRMAAHGLKIESIQIRNVMPDPVLSQAISDRAAAREKALQAEIDQKRQITEAETRKQVAERDAAAQITAAQGEAEANRILNESLTPELLLLRQIEALEKANTVYITPGTSLIVQQPK